MSCADDRYEDVRFTDEALAEVDDSVDVAPEPVGRRTLNVIGDLADYNPASERTAA
ncbi:hypothetical protein [Kitasatospora camelliae]|uniref:Uncharacterized protein n=1 Tax=Kitasatospora camelliae TaxID=3156397 RepID=A0AAU8K2R1_9ACTN